MKDLKIKINRCVFSTSSPAGLVFENKSYSTENLENNPIETLSGY